jgi:hypothetical protein
MSQQPRLPILLVCLLIALPAQVVLHELGHIAAARLTGDAEATVRLAQQEPGGWLRLGAAHYDGTKLSAVGRVVAPLGGLLLTQCVALALLGGEHAVAPARADVRGGGGWRAPPRCAHTGRMGDHH